MLQQRSSKQQYYYKDKKDTFERWINWFSDSSLSVNRFAQMNQTARSLPRWAQSWARIVGALSDGSDRSRIRIQSPWSYESLCVCVVITYKGAQVNKSSLCNYKFHIMTFTAQAEKILFQI